MGDPGKGESLYGSRSIKKAAHPHKKSRIKWQEGQKAKKEARERKEAKKEAIDAEMTAEGCSKREIKKKVTFRLNKEDSGVQINLGKGQF